MKKVFAVIKRVHWDNRLQRCNFIAWVSHMILMWSQQPWIMCLDYLCFVVMCLSLGAITIQHLRWLKDRHIYEAANKRTIHTLKALRDIPPTSSSVVIDSRVEQAEAAIAEHNRIAKDFAEKWDK